MPELDIEFEVPGKYEISEKMAARIANDFSYHAPFGDQVARYAAVRALIASTAMGLAQLCPESRELSVAFTHLDGAMMQANAAIARGEKPTIEEMEEVVAWGDIIITLKKETSAMGKTGRDLLASMRNRAIENEESQEDRKIGGDDGTDIE